MAGSGNGFVLVGDVVGDAVGQVSEVALVIFIREGDGECEIYWALRGESMVEDNANLISILSLMREILLKRHL